MDGKTQGFPAEHQPNHHTASAGLPPAHSSSWWQNEATHMYPAIHIKKKHDSSDQGTPYQCSMS